MSNVFVSYRRQDSSDITGRISDYLKAKHGAYSLFKDVDSIPAGEDFREILRDAVNQCDVVLAVIGKEWISAMDANGRRRVDDPNDYVRVEILTALERKIPVIPVLVENVAMPPAEELPEPLRPLVFRNAVPVRPDPDFHNDADRLSREVGRILKKRGRTKRANLLTSPAGIAGVVTSCALLIGLLAWHWWPGPVTLEKPPAGSLYFLGIAINDYPKKLFPGLKYTVNDVARLSGVLESYKPGNRRFHSQLLVNSEAKKERILSELHRLREQLNEEESATGLIAFSGIEGPVRHVYALLPFDVDPDRIEDTGITVKEIFDCIPNARGKILISIDTCHAEVIMEKFRALNPTLTTFSACRSNETAAEAEYGKEGEKVGGGAFTTAMIQGLSGEADQQQHGGNNDGLVTLAELWPFVERRTIELTNDHQHPAKNGELFDFVLTAPGRQQTR